MSQYPIVKYRPKFQTRLIGANFDRKTTGKLLFLGTILILLFCCIYLPFKGIRYNSNTNSLASTDYSGVTILQPKAPQTSKADPVATKDEPAQKDTKAITAPDTKSITTPSINLSFWPKMRFPDLISPIGSTINQITEGFGQVETSPTKTKNVLDFGSPNNTGLAPSNLSIDPFAINNSKIEAVSGKVVWQDGVNYSVKSDKFLIKSSLIIQAGGKDQTLVIDNSGLLPANALLAVNRETFIKLGGDPNTQTSIDAVVKTR